MRRHVTPSRRAFTLMESLMVVTILGIIAAGTLPIMQGVATNAAASDRTRRVSESGAYAIDRIARMLRDAPPGVTNGTINLAAAAADTISFADGRSLFMKGDELWYRNTDGAEDALITNVQEFEITYLAADGVTDTSATPHTTQRFIVRLVTGGLELRIAIFPRVRLAA